ncbi:MAG: DUF1501 domain-containing protein [Pseudomonadota bacterium]
MTNRRDFLKTMTAAASMVGMAGAPKFSFAQQAGQKTFIKVFMRGGADGLHLFPLIGDPFYYQYRPDIAIEPPSNDINSALDLGSTMRGMNPNLEMLMEIWDTGNMMLAPATSFDPSNRSHFDCQRWIGTGQTRNNLIDGYLNRFMQTNAGPDHPLRGLVAGKTSISTEARGAIQVPAINDANGFNLTNNDFCEGAGCADNQLTELMREIHSHDVDLSAVEGQVRDNQLIMLDSIAEVQAAGMDYTPSAGGLDYSNSGLGRGLRLCAQLLKAGVPLEVAALDWNIGWDTHSNQISDSNNRFTDQEKSYHNRMVQGATDFLCFYRDMGMMMNDVVVLVGSEFGRTKKQNGSVGTDHGEGGAWFAFGGPTTRAIASDVTTIDDTVVNRNWLPTVTNYRNIIGEIMVRHMAMPENLVSTIFPNHAFENYQLFSANA